jgi:actin-related protein
MQEMHKSSGLVIELGHSISSIIGYFQGFEIQPSERFFLIVGKIIADEFAKIVENTLKQKISTYERVRMIDKYFYIVDNYELEKEKFERKLIQPVEVSLSLTSKLISINSERFRLSEALFHPQLINHVIDGLAITLRDAIMACPIDTRPEILENVILSAGLSKLRGLDKRIKTELMKLFPNLEINILTHQRQETTA